jgi:hypothetical protein
MLSYPIDEAEALLGSKLTTAQTSLTNCEEDLDFLREQITVCLGLSDIVNTHSDIKLDNGGCHRKSI